MFFKFVDLAKDAQPLLVFSVSTGVINQNPEVKKQVYLFLVYLFFGR